MLTVPCFSISLSVLLQDHLFAPDANTMYGPHHATYVDLEVSGQSLC
jgi:hypothetical protein